MLLTVFIGSGSGATLTVALSLLFVLFQSVSLQLTVTLFVAFIILFVYFAREYIFNVTFVPFSINPMYHMFALALYCVPFVALHLMNSNSLNGNTSFNVTFVALVPLAAFEITIVQIAMSSVKYTSLSEVLFTDKSTIGFG